MSPAWRRRLESVAAFLLGVTIGAGGVAVLEWATRPKCPKCGKRMRPAYG